MAVACVLQWDSVLQLAEESPNVISARAEVVANSIANAQAMSAAGHNLNGRGKTRIAALPRIAELPKSTARSLPGDDYPTITGSANPALARTPMTPGPEGRQLLLAGAHPVEGSLSHARRDSSGSSLTQVPFGGA